MNSYELKLTRLKWLLCPYDYCHHDLEIYIEVDPWNILHIKVNNKKLSSQEHPAYLYQHGFLP